MIKKYHYYWLVVLIFPVIFKFHERLPAWDDAGVLAASYSFAFAFWNFDVSGMIQLLNFPKNPLLLLLNIPWGGFPLSGYGCALGLATLSLLISSMALICAYLLYKLKIPLLISIIPFISILTSNAFYIFSGIFIGDNLNLFTSAAFMLLFILEIENPPTDEKQVKIHSILLGYVFLIGMLTKISFAFLIVLYIPIILIYLYKILNKNLYIKYIIYFIPFLFVTTLIIIPGIKFQLQHAQYWSSIVLDANKKASLHLLYSYMTNNYKGILYAIIIYILLYTIFIFLKKIYFTAIYTKLYVLLSIILYFCIAARANNLEIHYIAMPLLLLSFLLSTLFSKKQLNLDDKKNPYIILCIIIILSISTYKNYNFSNIKKFQYAIEKIKSPDGKPYMVVTDTSFLNVSNFDLAHTLLYKRYNTTHGISRCVFHGESIDRCKKQLINYDTVIFQWPLPNKNAVHPYNLYAIDYYNYMKNQKNYTEEIIGNICIYKKNDM